MGSPKGGAAGAAQRMVGGFSSNEAALLHICRELGAEPGQDCIHGVAEIRYAYVRSALSPRPGTVETLSTLKDAGYRVGLISNCGEDVSRLWHSTPFAPLMDAAVLSFDAGLAKPDRRIYELAIGRLGVAAEHCLYVGDGTAGELSGASKGRHDRRANEGPVRPGGRRPRRLEGRDDIGHPRRAGTVELTRAVPAWALWTRVCSHYCSVGVWGCGGGVARRWALGARTVRRIR